jgi:hypothetical protein
MFLSDRRIYLNLTFHLFIIDFRKKNFGDFLNKMSNIKFIHIILQFALLLVGEVNHIINNRK